MMLTSREMADRGELTGACLGALAESVADEARGIGDLEARLAAKLAAGRARWSGLEVAPARFVRFLAERIPLDVPFDAGLDSLYAEDLYLTCACTDGNPRAIEQFDAAHATTVDVALARLG